ncbi:alpha/beta fold hydrolase [Streptomyces sp. NPDC059851]|uniref:type I polyketide synthase n=1 Tax=Streptomyces sp. NPDC059851 TaxID=3346971 RepID=UPI00365D3CDB
MALHAHDYLTTPAPDGPDGWTTPRPTLPEVFAAAVTARGDDTAVVAPDADDNRSWQDWRTDADAFGRALQDLGIRPGDVVAAQLPNSWAFLVAHVGIAAVGAVLLPLHSTLGTREVAALLQRTAARALILPAAAQPPARTELPALEFLIPVGPEAPPAGPGPGSYEELVRERRGLAPHPVEVTPDMPLVLMPSSGTTSARPKICIHTHGGLLGNATVTAVEGRSSAEDVLVCASPFTHLFGLFSVHLSLIAGGRQALLPRWDADAFRELAAATRASVLFAVPAQLRDLVEAETPGPVAALREVRTGGAAVPAALVAGVRRILGAATVVQWGMSEVGAGLSTAPDDPPEVAARSIGRPVGEGRVRVVGEDGAPCPAGETGELQFRGPSLFRGYLADPEATAAAMTADGWLRTGDLACRYEDGTIGYRGRQAERINVGGLKFSASEVEALLADLPQLANAAVAGRADERLGEYPVLLAQLRPGARLTLEEVRAHLAARGVAAYKWPLELVVVDAVPVTPTRKVARGRLAALLAQPAREAVPSWAQRIAGLPERAALDAALALVREQAAAVGGARLAQADTGVSFRSAGLDSLGAVRLASGLGERTGMALSTTAVFDHPTPGHLARHLVGLATGAAGSAAGTPAAVPGPVTGPVGAAGGTEADAVAVVGIGCRFPGGIASPEDLWRLLVEGDETVGPFPADRGWDLDHLHDADRNRPGTSYVRHGGFLEGAADFDAEFFGLSPREALAMDPQQRLLLETTWEALERAGIPPSALRDSPAAVFVGLMSSDYAPRLQEAPALHDGLLLTGNASSVAAGRIAYTLGLTGPAITVDTACSASLVALHLARQALLRGECSLALAGGATVMSTPASFVDFSRQGALSPDGRCRAFSASADGAGWSEGAGILVLERLSDARRAGRPVLAVLSGSAVNQDGASNGLSAPSGPAQRDVVRLALADAGLTPADVDLVEAHGTGTPLGDRIEAEALLSSYGRGRDAERPLWLGSLKSNIGHTQAAAGVAGVIKAVLALRHAEMPRSLHAEEPTPHVNWEAGGVRLLHAPRPWPRPADGGPRTAGVSAFGISGTNAHVILQEPAAEDTTPTADPAPEPATTADPATTPAPTPVAAEAAVPWVLAAKDRPGLRDLASRLGQAAAGAGPEEMGRALAVHRAPNDPAFRRRAVVVADGVHGADRAARLRAGLADLAAGRENPDLVTGVLPAGGTGRTVFVFPGQGSQWEAMGAELLRDSPVFAEAAAACDEAFAPYVDWSVLAVLRGDAGGPPLTRVDVAQTALFTMMVSLTALWRSYGVEPDAVLGHSQGEIAAAYVSGALTLPQAARIVALRARAVRGLPAGAMAAVSLPGPELADRLAGRNGPTLSVAAENAPRASVVAGDPGAVDALLAELAAEGVRARKVAVDYASHCAAVEPLEAVLAEDLAGTLPGAVSTPFLSTVDGAWLTGQELTAEYWYRNLRSPVAFAPAVATLLEAGFRTFVEVGPHPVLTYAVQETAEQVGVPALVTGSLRRGEGGVRRLLLSAAEAWVQGVGVDWSAVSVGSRPVRADVLPTYPFQRRRYWLSARPAARPAGSGYGAAPPDGAAGPVPAAEPLDADALLSLVRESAAAVLGYGDADSVDPDRPFLELGAGSLAAVELRGRLSRALDLALPSTVVFDHPTARGLAGHLWDGLDRPNRPEDAPPASGTAPVVAADDPRPAPAPDRDRAPHPNRVPGGPLPDGLSQLFRQASADGRGAVAVELVATASLLRPSFTAAEAPGRVQRPVRLAGGGDGSGAVPALVCLPSLVPTGGPHEYARLAAEFAGRRGVLALPQPGFGPGEALPADLGALVDVHLGALAQRADDGPVLLCGHSSGGWIAWAVAAQLARQGRPVAGLVLIDTPWHEGAAPSDDLSLLLAAAERRQRASDGNGEIGTNRLTATGRYLRILRGWRPEPLDVPAPALLLRAREPIGRPVAWRLPHTVREVPGDHFTMMENHAAEIAAAIDAWEHDRYAYDPTRADPVDQYRDHDRTEEKQETAR